MEQLIDAKTPTTLIVSIIILLALNLFAKLGSFVFDLLKKKADTTERAMGKMTLALQENSKALEQLKSEIASIHKELSDVGKLRLDLRRYYGALKLLAKEDWPKIRDEIMKESEL